MKIVIVGAGSVGVACAHTLACDGHRVLVYEKNQAVVEEASFGSAGWLVPALLQPGVAAGLNKPAAWHLARRIKNRIRLRLHWPWQQAASPLQALHRCDTPPAAWLTLERLAAYGVPLLHQLQQQWELDVECVRGSLVLLRDAQELATLRPALDALGQAGVRWQRLDATQVRALEPALGHSLPATLDFTHALHFADGVAANTRLLTQLQRQSAQAAGARFATGCQVRQLIAAQGSGQRAQLLLAGHEKPLAFDAIIICSGADTQQLLTPLGLRPPLVLQHGYTLSAPLRTAALGQEPAPMPRHALLHWSAQITLLRLGQRVRVAGGSALGAAPHATMHPPTLARLRTAAGALLPGCALWHGAGVQYWHGSRLHTPDGLPLLGASGLPGIWLNVGHGNCGTAIAQGCARVLADMLAGRTPPVDAAPLQAQRHLPPRLAPAASGRGSGAGN